MIATVVPRSGTANRKLVGREWAAFAPEWIARSEEHRDNAREGFLDDWMLRIIGEVAGVDVIDLGCGEGRFCRMLADRGARTLGIDLQPVFVAYADAKKSDRERYGLGDMQHLAGASGDSFEVAVSYITLVDVPDQRAAIAEAFRVLRPRGRFVVCSVSPMASAWSTHGPWHVGEGGANLHFVLDDYATEGPRRVVWRSGHEVTNFHRMLSTTVNDLLDTRFILRGLYEPVPNEPAGDGSGASGCARDLAVVKARGLDDPEPHEERRPRSLSASVMRHQRHRAEPLAA